MGRFQLELIYLYFPPSSIILDGTTVENKGKLILIELGWLTQKYRHSLRDSTFHVLARTAEKWNVLGNLFCIVNSCEQTKREDRSRYNGNMYIFQFIHFHQQKKLGQLFPHFLQDIITVYSGYGKQVAWEDWSWGWINDGIQWVTLKQINTNAVIKGNLPDNVATINCRIQSVARNEATEYRIFALYFIHT